MSWWKSCWYVRELIEHLIDLREDYFSHCLSFCIQVDAGENAGTHTSACMDARTHTHTHAHTRTHTRTQTHTHTPHTHTRGILIVFCLTFV